MCVFIIITIIIGLNITKLLGPIAVKVSELSLKITPIPGHFECTVLGDSSNELVLRWGCLWSRWNEDMENYSESKERREHLSGTLSPLNFWRNHSPHVLTVFMLLH